MNLPRSSYYYCPNAPETTSEHRALTERIEGIAEEFPRYGYRKVTAQLRREGLLVNHKRIQRVMRERGLGVKKRRRFVRTTDSDHPYPVYPNLIKHQAVTGVNQVWVADLTYIRITMTFVYLAVILDLYSRKAIGYALSEQIDTDLSLKALWMALQRRHPSPGVIHHSDRGVQYAAHEYIDVLRAYQFRISMSRKGNPYDNAAAESFIKTLKTEEVYLWEYQTMADVQRRLPYFIEDVYNRKRLHASLGYRPPVEYETMFVPETLNHPCLTLT